MATRAWQFADGRSWPVDAQEAGDELERIRQENGGLRPEGVVEAARPEAALLHACFDWDDARAAEKYRREQAASLIRSVRVLVVDEETGDKEPVRAFLCVIPEGADASSYVPRAEVARTPSLLNQAINDAVAYLRHAEDRLRELRGMRREADNIKQIRLRLEKQGDNEAHP